VARGRMGGHHGLAGSANPNNISVIAPCGEMASFPIGPTPFLLEIHSARGSSVQETPPRTPNDAAGQEAGRYLPNADPANPWRSQEHALEETCGMRGDTRDKWTTRESATLVSASCGTLVPRTWYG
jgi:hypothetical protein